MQMDPDRSRGCLLGLAVGDAVGTTVEFKKRGSFPPLTNMVGVSITQTPSAQPFCKPSISETMQIAGALYGETGIPVKWLERLFQSGRAIGKSFILKSITVEQ